MDFPPHLHDDVEIIYVYEGKCTAFCEGKKYELKTGNFFIIFPNQIHYYTDSDKDGKYFVNIFKPSALLQYADVFDDRIPNNAVFNCGSDNDTVLAIIDNFVKCGNNCPKDLQVSFETLIFGIVLRHINLVWRTVTRESVANVVNYCTSHFKEDISAISVAAALNISKSYVSFIFSNFLRINFREYINTLRINEAMRIIENENYGMTEIAYKVGFNNLRTFNRAFNLKNGMTPTKYKKIIRMTDV